MGYPMTYRRVVNRNRLADGGYEGTPAVEWHTPGGAVAWSVIEDDPKMLRAIGERLVEQITPTIANDINRRVSLLMGDLRRLEKDAVDEGAICQGIARKTGIDPNVVAVVIQEFMEVR